MCQFHRFHGSIIFLLLAIVVCICPLVMAQENVHHNIAFAPFAFLSNPDSIPFAGPVNYDAGVHPTWVFCTDLDGDLDLDLAVSNRESANVSILKNKGDGTFQPRVDYEAGNGPEFVFCADLDGDLDPDLAVANHSDNNVSVLKNNGDGTFQGKVDYATGSGPSSVFCADLDGDSDLDLAVVNRGGKSVSILKNNGNGTFQTKVDYSVGNEPVILFCADLDGDLDSDLAVPNASSADVSVLKNNGDGTFQIKVDYPAGNHPNSVFCADLDNDLDLDLAVANCLSDDVSILKNNGDGTFQDKVDYTAGEHPNSVFCSDLDKDGNFDLILPNVDSDNVSILKNNGDGTFQPAVNYETDNHPTSVYCADLNGDLDLDLAVTNYGSDNVSILENLTADFLVGYWKFDEGTGDTAYDASGHGNHGTLMNGPVWVDGMSGKALEFDGVDDYVYVSNSPSLQISDSITVMSWTKVEAATGDHQEICVKWYEDLGQFTGSFALEFQPDGGRPQFAILNSIRIVEYAISDTVIPLGQWAHIAGTYDGDSVKIYVNGVPTGSTPHSGTINVGDQPVVIGSHTHPEDRNWLNGLIDEVKIFPRALSEDEIKQQLNLPPDAFSLLLPEDGVTIATVVTFDWEDATDPNLDDTVRYDLYVSTSSIFHPDSTVVHDSLLTSEYSDYLDVGTHYWKVKACDKWGGARWSDQIWSFYVFSAPYGFSLLSPLNLDSVSTPVDFDWEDAIDPEPNDTVRYTSFISRSPSFHPDSTTVYDSLLQSQCEDSLEIGLYYWRVKAYDTWGLVTWSNETWSFYAFLCGDVNADGTIQLSDVVYLINYVLKAGNPPIPLEAGDVNCDGNVDVVDVVYLINYLFKGGPPPC